MDMVNLIQQKRDNQAHSREDLEKLVQGILDKSIPDYQLSAWLMAVYFNGMNDEETTHFTRAVAYQGDTLDLSSIEGVKVDKHSTGGVGDKVTLVLGPLMASAGVIVAKLSGRGLGHTGGTVDKFEAIPGYQTAIENDDFYRQLNEIGVVLAGQSHDLAPADKVLYALRDVTSTIESTPLIAASVLSKKIASGADVIVLDVKYGSGAFMPTYEAARTLSLKLVQIGKNLDRHVSVLLSDMEQPLGHAIGHSLEVEEAIATLRGEGPDDLLEVTLTLGAMQLVNAKKADNLDAAKAILLDKIQSGEALEKFRSLVLAQKGDPSVIENPDIMGRASIELPLKATQSGYVKNLIALEVGHALKALGGGRETKEDILDLEVGIRVHKKIGDAVETGETLATLYANDADKAEEAAHILKTAYEIGESQPEEARLIREIIWAE